MTPANFAKQSQKVDTQYSFRYNVFMLKNSIQATNPNHFRKATDMSKAEKMFTVAGTATNPDGTTKARFANDLVARIKILTKAGCTNINLVELPQPMTKLAALQHLQTLGITEGDAGYAVANKLAEKAKEAKKGEVRVTLAKGKGKVKAEAKDESEAV